LLLLPARQLALALPITMAIGFFAGLIMDTGELKRYMVPVTIMMIYPNMIGFKLSDMLSLSQSRLVFTSLALNYTLVPLAAYLLGTGFLLRDPELFAGLAIMSLLPTSNMTVAFTTLAGGNTRAAVKLTVAGLVAGALLAPWYLLLLVGQYVPVDVGATLQSIATVVLVPMVLGTTTYSLLRKRYTPQEIQERFATYFPGISSCGMLFLIFTAVSTNAQRILAQPDLLAIALLVQIAFYGFTYLLAFAVGWKFFDVGDSYALVFSVALRSLAISIGLAATTFGPNAALMVTLGIPLQSQSAAWLVRLKGRSKLLSGRAWSKP